MSDLLTAKDVEVKQFKKVRFGGYSIPEVEDFLNQVADDIEAYAIQLDEKDARITELEAYAEKQDEMTDAIKDALIQARQSAKEIEEKAKAQTEKMIEDARAEAAKIIEDAKAQSSQIITEADDTLQDRRARADMSLAGIEQELESRRQEAELKADEIVSSAKSEARKMLANAEKEATEYDNQIRLLNLRKQQFLEDAFSLLADFGKVIERAQEEIDADMQNEAMNLMNKAPEGMIEEEGIVEEN